MKIQGNRSERSSSPNSRSTTILFWTWIICLLSSATQPVLAQVPPYYQGSIQPQVQPIWSKRFGPEGGFAQARAVAVDASGIYVVGFTDADAFLRKYDHNGNELWDRPTVGSSGVAGDPSSIYVVGGNALRKYGHAGNELWTQFLADCCGVIAVNGVAVHVSGVYVIGSLDLPHDLPPVSPNLPFLWKFDHAGNLLWTRQLAQPSPWSPNRLLKK